MDDLARRGVECGEQHELLAVLDHGSLIEKNHRWDLGDEPPVRRRETIAELLNPVLDRDVGAVNTDSAQHSLGFAQAHTVVVEDDGKLDGERIGAVALEELNIFERFLQSGKVQ